jgi:hypothetical protein
MDPRKLFADRRHSGFCVYCGGPVETVDHVPSKALLDEPYPADLPTVVACSACNQGFSLDEEYLSCLIECTLRGSTEPAKQHRPSIRKTLTAKPALRADLETARSVVDGEILWCPVASRVENVIVKLARGHLAFEEGTPMLGEPDVIDYVPRTGISAEEAQELTCAWPLERAWPEIGSRAFFRASGMRVPHNPGSDGWITVQEDRYRYRAEGTMAQMVLSEYLICTVVWD